MGRTRRRSERQRQKLKDRFSQSEANEAVDFEITLAALLATANLAYQHPEFPLISQGAAFGILLLTLVRRVSLLSSFADQKRLMKHTIPFIEFSAVTGVIALLFVLQLKLEISLSWFWAAVFFAIILVITVHELVFRDQILWWHFKFAEKFESKKDSQAWAFMTFKTWEWSNASETESGRHRFYSGPSGEIQEEYSRKEMLWLFFKGVFWVTLAFIILLIIGFLLLGVAGIIVVFVAISIRDQVRFWYSAYGNAIFEEMAGPWWRTHLMVLFYLALFYTLI